MSEIIKPKEITNTFNIHIFLCDKCNKKILESREDIYDGYYAEPYEEISLNILDEWYNVTLCLCDECMEKYRVELIKCLATFGFQKEEI